MEIKDKKQTKPGRLVKLIIKLLVTVVCIWYVSTKLDFKELGQALRSVNWILFGGGIVLYAVSKLAGAFRLNIYFKNIGIDMPAAVNIQLYWLGLFYNLFLPGSISGDAYKVIMLSKKTGRSYRKLTSAVILDRLTGLLGLGLVLSFFGALVLHDGFYIACLIALAVLLVALAYYIVKKWFPDFLPGFWPTFFLGLLVQVFANSSAWLIILSLGIDYSINQYMFIFLVASIAAVLPLTLGGLGAREIVFLELSKYFGLPEHSSVLIGFLVYIAVLITSAWGLVYIFADPLKKMEIGKQQFPGNEL
jgi:uncharacterized membrane protein YbhN (UPF0104 family)